MTASSVPASGIEPLHGGDWSGSDDVDDDGLEMEMAMQGFGAPWSEDDEGEGEGDVV